MPGGVVVGGAVAGQGGERSGPCGVSVERSGGGVGDELAFFLRLGGKSKAMPRWGGEEKGGIKGRVNSVEFSTRMCHGVTVDYSAMC